MAYKKPTSRTITVASGGTTSAAFGVGDYIIAGLQTPSALTSTAITFTGSTEPSGTFVPVYDSDGNQVSLSVSTSRGVGLSGSESDAVAAWPWLKLVCGSTELGDRSFIFSLK
jgi:hypothetical protein